MVKTDDGFDFVDVLEAAKREQLHLTQIRDLERDRIELKNEVAEMRDKMLS